MATSNLEERLLGQILGEGLPAPLREYRFHPTRRWRFDFAYPELKIAIEVEGGLYGKKVVCHKCKTIVLQRTSSGRPTPVFTGGGHNTGKGFEEDVIKYNEAAILGWTVIRITGKMIRNLSGIEHIRRVMSGK